MPEEITEGELSCCRVCGSEELYKFLDFGEQALANSLVKEKDGIDQRYPLSLSWCGRCHLVQLNYTVSPSVLFSEYVWTTSSSHTAWEYSFQFYDSVMRLLKPGQRKILDVGSNDGTFLVPFRDRDCMVLGVDPARNIVEMANKNGVPTMLGFFSKELSESIIKGYGLFDVVMARNVLPHVANTNDFVDGLVSCLSDDGLCVIEFHYARQIMDGLHYDSIYHEHLCYFTVETMEYLLNSHGLHIHCIMPSPISGGSLVVFCRKYPRVADSIGQSEWYRLHEHNGLLDWIGFSEKVWSHIDSFKRLLLECHQAFDSVCGYGASARSSTLLNVSKVDVSLISCIADGSRLKQGLYTSGNHIPIVSPEVMVRGSPGCVCVLAWNLGDEIRRVLRDELGYGGKVLLPLPGEPRLL